MGNSLEGNGADTPPRGTTPSGHRPQVTFRARDEWRAWLARLAAREKCPVPVLLDRLLAEHARRTRFDPPPDRL